MEKEKFEKLVADALDSIPPKFKKYIANLAVIIKDEASPEIFSQTGVPRFSSILGHYHGVPFQYRGPYYGNNPPDVIVIYQKPIEHICSSDKEIREKIREVVLHEVGHYFGLSDKDLREIERE